MAIVSATRLSARRGPIGVGLLGVLALLPGTRAGAQITESLSSTSSYQYDLVPGLPGTDQGTGDAGVFHVIGDVPGQATDIQINYSVLLAPDSSFFFLHNIQCKGYCSVGVMTSMTDTVTNTGSETADLRFDSNITPGHFGLVHNAATQTSGAFQFQISQQTDTGSRQLYEAIGQISSAGASIATSDGSVFNGLTTYHDPAQTGLDWDETDLSLLLDPLAPGETTTITYTAITYLDSYGFCTDVTRCDGVQVAFGDPRNNGGIIRGQPVPGANQFDLSEPVGFVLDRGFDMARLKFDIVPLSPVPEPATWATMVAGFAMCGMAWRTRRGLGRVAA